VSARIARSIFALIREVRSAQCLPRLDSSCGHFSAKTYGDGNGWLRVVRPALVGEAQWPEDQDRGLSVRKLHAARIVRRSADFNLAKGVYTRVDGRKRRGKSFKKEIVPIVSSDAA